jgi:ATP-binding cassette subfamily B protein
VSLWTQTWRVMGPAVRSAPLPVALVLVLQILNAARPAVLVWITSGFVDALVAHRHILSWVIAFAVTAGVEQATNTFGNGLVTGWVQDVVSTYVQRQVLAKGASVALETFFDADFNARMTQAREELGTRLSRVVGQALVFLNSSISTIGVIGVVSRLGAPAVLVPVVFSSVVTIVASRVLGQVDVKRSQRVAHPRRMAGAWVSLVSGRETLPEVRLFGATEWAIRNWKRAYEECATAELEAARASFGWTGAASGVSIAAWGLVLLVGAHAALVAGPQRAAGVFAGVWAGVSMAQTYFQYALNSASGLRRASLVLVEMGQVLGERGHASDASPTCEAGNGGARARAHDIVIDGLGYRYPAAERSAVVGVSFRVEPGETVALVGPNGSGKSTLGALILGLLSPVEGSVTIGGLPAMRQAGSAVLQDFARYHLRVRDNVAFSALPKLGDDAALSAALADAGSMLSGDLDTWLGPEFDGRDLSGGEWVRLAIARGLLSDRGLVVMDEPNAAIDPLAETDLMRRLVESVGGRTALVVSHRLGLARIADRVIVCDGGRVVEAGTHETLVSAGGLYARMWNAQAAWYTTIEPERAPGGL